MGVLMTYYRDCSADEWLMIFWLLQAGMEESALSFMIGG